jgi:hypothetical protein
MQFFNYSAQQRVSTINGHFFAKMVVLNEMPEMAIFTPVQLEWFLDTKEATR